MAERMRRASQRRSVVVRMRSEGKTLQEIGDHLGVTRQRVRQMIQRHQHFHAILDGQERTK